MVNANKTERIKFWEENLKWYKNYAKEFKSFNNKEFIKSGIKKCKENIKKLKKER